MPSVQQENVMQLPIVVATTHNNQQFTYNGFNGVHQLSGVLVFQFSDEFDIDRIWVDANGSFVCEE